MFVTFVAIAIVISVLIFTTFVLPKLIVRLTTTIRAQNTAASQLDKDAEIKLENKISLIIDFTLFVIAFLGNGAEMFTKRFQATERFRTYLQSISLSILVAGLFTLALGSWHDRKGLTGYAESRERMNKLRRGAIIGIVISATLYILSVM
ncbi:MAG: hypothetical protein LBC28_00395 [Oscillospiraceae bacterium]|nr:hypothetical protein [Oscillospiraceae bacterium]